MLRLYSRQITLDAKCSEQNEAIELSLFIRGTLEFPHIFKRDITLKLESLGLERDREEIIHVLLWPLVCV